MSSAEGTPVWFELITPDQDAARDFYTKVAGWTIAESAMPEHGGYRLASAPDGAQVAGLMKPPPGLTTFGWTLYFATADVDAAAGRVKELGGAVLFGPMDIPHVGRFATVADPQGIVFNLLTGSSPEGSQAFAAAPGALGHGVWIELATPDPDGAFAFYGKMFGWEKAGAMPMGEAGDYAFIGKGADFRPGAVMSSTTTGAPARWNWYVHVADIDAAIAAAKAHGGALLQGPDQIPGGDYSANVADAQGCQLGLVGPRK
ncbi:VOC family protein [Sphingomonas sp. MMSM20]|uniref:VOC family protein n=1 Tax=Sphingomonas lycopersici TaxID=2951807 RepID=UPI0022383BF6|nr:VOC family protein [Sphingomonas lycopersici]MCW6531660.1 VOC family protein [Sphingomonas lycopersici]